MLCLAKDIHTFNQEQLGGNSSSRGNSSSSGSDVYRAAAAAKQQRQQRRKSSGSSGGKRRGSSGRAAAAAAVAEQQRQSSSGSSKRAAAAAAVTHVRQGQWLKPAQSETLAAAGSCCCTTCIPVEYIYGRIGGCCMCWHSRDQLYQFEEVKLLLHSLENLLFFFQLQLLKFLFFLSAYICVCGSCSTLSWYLCSAG